MFIVSSLDQPTKHTNADALSRLQLGDKPSNVPVPAEMVLLTEMLESAPVTAVQIANWAKKDTILLKVIYGRMAQFR